MKINFKFKGKRVDNGEWAIGYLFVGTIPYNPKQENKTYIISVYHKPDEVDPETVTMIEDF